MNYNHIYQTFAIGIHWKIEQTLQNKLSSLKKLDIGNAVVLQVKLFVERWIALQLLNRSAKNQSQFFSKALDLHPPDYLVVMKTTTMRIKDTYWGVVSWTLDIGR